MGLLIWLVGLAVLAMLVVFVIVAFWLQDRLNSIQRAVTAEIQAKSDKDRQNTRSLAVKLGEGTPVNEAVHTWQETRASIHATTGGAERWRWSAADLAEWGRAEIQRRSDEVRQRITKNLVLFTAASLLVVAVPATWIYYRAAGAATAVYSGGDIPTTNWLDRLMNAAADRLETHSKPAPDQFPAVDQAVIPGGLDEPDVSDEFRVELDPDTLQHHK